MKVPLNWLRQYVDIDIPTSELVTRLTSIGHMQDKQPERVGEDTVIDLEVRQNRSDCYSILGIAREVAAITGNKVKYPISNTQYPNTYISSKDQTLTISNTDPSLCPRFKAIRIKLKTQNSKLATPAWMRSHLEAYGVKCISPIVDITNYVMIEQGEPCHAFDSRSVVDAHIMIRRARADEKVTILGGRELTLTTDDLVIADSDKVLSFSGLIGAAGTGMRDDSTDFILEAATYDQATIRRSSLRHGVRTEASTRHEKFLDPRLVEVTLDRALALLGEMGEYEILTTLESYEYPVTPRQLDLRLGEVARLGGIDITIDETQKYLESLGFVTDINYQLSIINCIVPLWRTDIQIEADLVEEVLRLYGYDRIPSSLPPHAPPADITSYWYTLDDQVRDYSVRIGLDEVMTEPLTSTQRLSEYETMEQHVVPVVLQNALNVTKSMLRFVMDEGLAHALDHQKKFGRAKIELFELGKVYSKSRDPQNTSPYHEPRHYAYVLYDDSSPHTLIYRRAKGIAQGICEELGVTYHDDIVNLHVWDEHTVYGCINLTRHMSPQQRSPAGKSHQVLTQIVNERSFDVSCLIPAGTAVGPILTDLKGHVVELTSVALGEDPLVDGDSKRILIRCHLRSDATDAEVVRSRVSDRLVNQHKAVIR